MKTTGKSIDIFGDSFSDPESRSDNSDTWLDILENNYKFKLKNFSFHGVGSQWCIEKLMGIDEYGDFLLFLSPDMNRITFDYLDDDESVMGRMIYNIMDQNTMKKILSDKLIDMSDRIYKDYKSFYTSGLYRILEILFASFVFSKCKKYNKILIWPSSGLGFPFRHYSKTLEIPLNCHIVSKCLNFISHREFKNTNSAAIPSLTTYPDKRNNHLSYENHVILAKQIDDYFSNNVEPNFRKFKKEII